MACDLVTYAAVAQRLGFPVLTGRELELDGASHYSAMLHFGPAQVDGWLADLAAGELQWQTVFIRKVIKRFM